MLRLTVRKRIAVAGTGVVTWFACRAGLWRAEIARVNDPRGLASQQQRGSGNRDQLAE